MVSIPLDPLGLVQPGQNLLQEGIGIALTWVDAEFGDPDGLVEGLVELGEVVLEVVGVGPGIVVGNNEVDLAVAAASHELLEVIYAFVGLVTIGDGGRADLQTGAGKGLDVLLVCSDGLVDGDVGAAATVVSQNYDDNTRLLSLNLPRLIRLVEAEDIFDIVFGACVGDVLRPARCAPVLVAVEERNIFKTRDGLAINDGFPVIHPSDLRMACESVGERGSSLTIELLRECKTTLASLASGLNVLMTAVMHGSSLNHASESHEGKESRRLNHVDLRNECNGMNIPKECGIDRCDVKGETWCKSTGTSSGATVYLYQWRWDLRRPPKQRRSGSHRPTPALTCLSFFGKDSWPRFQMQKPPSCANTCE
tara:strand:- start:3932 stop:5029 length:1098 start_codon:yes stop_codon:yes gene_type:complete